MKTPGQELAGYLSATRGLLVNYGNTPHSDQIGTLTPRLPGPRPLSTGSNAPGWRVLCEEGEQINSPEAAVRAYFTGLNGSDVDGIVAMFAEDGSLMADEAPTATGHEELRRFFTGIFKAISGRRELHIDRIIEEGDLATAQTHTTGPLTMLDTNTTIQVLSRELFVLRKTRSGWRILD